MVAEFLICGSCSSRNIFNSKINEDYKSFFNIHPSLESVNFISLMSNPVEYNEKLLNSDNDYDNTCVRNDLTKDFLNVLRDTEVDYLIIDKQDSKYYSCYYKDSDCKEISCCNELNEKQKCQVKKEESSENGIESISILLIVSLFMIF